MHEMEKVFVCRVPYKQVYIYTHRSKKGVRYLHSQTSNISFEYYFRCDCTPLNKMI